MLPNKAFTTFHSADTKFVKPQRLSRQQLPVCYKYITPTKFKVPEGMHSDSGFDKDGVPLLFRASPLSLVELAGRAVDALPLPNVFDWDNHRVAVWIVKYGYPQYQNTFVQNLINGRTLLLLDASALSAMNIKDFDHIKDIAAGIRKLFLFEMTTFSRSLSLPPQFFNELYMLFRVKTGLKYASFRRTDLFRRLQMLRESPKYYNHWTLLQHWLNVVKKLPDGFMSEGPPEREIIAYTPKRDLHRCNRSGGFKRPPTQDEPPKKKPCFCIPPCECSETDSSWHCLYPAERNPQQPVSVELNYSRPCKYCFAKCRCNIPHSICNRKTLSLLKAHDSVALRRRPLQRQGGDFDQGSWDHLPISISGVSTATSAFSAWKSLAPMSPSQARLSVRFTE